jgi:hypothetical protein
MYLMPDEAIGQDAKELVVYQSPHEAAHYWRSSGTIDDWRTHVGSKCSGNSRLILSVSCAFAGPLLAPLGQVDLFEGMISVGRAKTSSGTGRIIPINDDLAAVLSAHRRWFVSRFGESHDDQYLFPFGSPQPTNPTGQLPTSVQDSILRGKPRA